EYVCLDISPRSLGFSTLRKDSRLLCAGSLLSSLFLSTVSFSFFSFLHLPSLLLCLSLSHFFLLSFLLSSLLFLSSFSFYVRSSRQAGKAMCRRANSLILPISYVSFLRLSGGSIMKIQTPAPSS
ncbi:hypothetical protein CSUI_006096, partial [Cystoisospora suis]